MIDYGEQLTQELEDARNELYKQITSVATKLQLLWEVVRTLIVFTIPILTGIGVTFLSQCYLPRTLAVFLSTISNGITIGLVFLNITPLNEAINNYVESRVYTPRFVNCSCKTCHDRNNCSQEQMGTTQDKPKDSVGHNCQQDTQEKSQTNVNTSTSDTARNLAGDNDETIRKRIISTENSAGNNVP